MTQTYLFDKSKEELIKEKIVLNCNITDNELANIIQCFASDNIAIIDVIIVFKVKGEIILKVQEIDISKITIEPEKELNKSSKSYFQGKEK